jgi:maltooligosyltrehalose synthase
MYTYNRFIGHNEVGDSPEFFGYNVNTFHELMKFRLKDWPHSMNATSTHDTKRGEDVRARLNVLTDLEEEWIELTNQWRQENDSLKTNGWPDANDEYLIYQTIVGSYPLEEKDLGPYRRRIAGYLRKALREAKVHSNWTSPNEDYERAAIEFAHALIANESPFMHSFQPFFDKIADYGMINSFGQLILKFTCPGVPDIYQGTELWDLSLVDPDNRRPVDYSIRMKMISEHKSLQDLWTTRRNGQIKLWLLQCLNIIRNRYIDVFADGEYIPLTISGQFKNRAIGFIRKNRYTSILVLIPLNFATVHEYSGLHDVPVADWKDTKVLLPGQPADWENLLNEGYVKIDGELSLNEAFKTFPALILKS